MVHQPCDGNVARARNLACLGRSFDWVFFVDGDCRLNNDLVRRACEIVCREKPAVWGAEYVCRPTTLWSRSYDSLQRGWVRLGEGLNLTGGCLAIPRSAWKQLRGFDEGIGWGGEDTQFLRRARDFGIPVRRFPGLRIQHEHALNSSKFLARAWMQGRQRGRYNLQTPISGSVKWQWLIRNCLEAPSLAAPTVMFLAVMTVGATWGAWTSRRYSRTGTMPRRVASVRRLAGVSPHLRGSRVSASKPAPLS